MIACDVRHCVSCISYTGTQSLNPVFCELKEHSELPQSEYVDDDQLYVDVVYRTAGNISWNEIWQFRGRGSNRQIKFHQ